MAEREEEPAQLALGIERIGLFPLRWPTIATILAIMLSVLAVIGIGRIKVDDSLSQLFRSDTPEFHQYEEVSRRFPSTEFDILIVLEGPNLLERGSLEAMRNLAIDVQLVPGTLGVLSLFSAREPPEEGHIPPPLFPDGLPQGAEYDALVKRIMANEIIHGKLLSEDAKLALGMF